MMREVTFHVPALASRPLLGSSCCVASAEAVIMQEFWMLGGVEDCAVDVDLGRVWARYDPSQVTPERLAAALAEIGLAVAPGREG